MAGPKGEDGQCAENEVPDGSDGPAGDLLLHGDQANVPQGPEAVKNGDEHLAGVRSVADQGYTAPITRSPFDPWHSEEYLLACLTRTHGWHWLEPGVLARRPRGC
jgi:hypothetical protein